MVKKAITTDKVVHRTAREKRQTAARTSAWRERKANELIEVRDLDKVLSEAVAMHARSLPEAQQRAFLARMIGLCVDGLAYQGHDRGNARSRVVDRLEHWCGSEVTSGSVRAALDRKALTLPRSSVAA